MPPPGIAHGGKMRADQPIGNFFCKGARMNNRSYSACVKAGNACPKGRGRRAEECRRMSQA